MAKTRDLSRREVAARIRAMRADGLTVWEIAIRTGLGRRTVRSVLRGEDVLSTARAAAVGRRLARYHGMLVITDGDARWVDPASHHDRSRVGRYWRAVDAWRRTGDDRLLDQFRDTPVRVRGRRRIWFETDPNVLRELDAAAHLTPDQIMEGHSP